MRTIIINENHLKEEDISKKVERVKAVILNSSGKVLLAFNNNTYQFLGGHVEEGEDRILSLKREIKEEAGIDVDIIEDAFLNIITYDNDYFGTGVKVKNSIFYYRVLSNLEPDFSKTRYDELELQSDFNLLYVDFNEFEKFLKNNISHGTIDENIGREMLYTLEEYQNIYGGIL